MALNDILPQSNVYKPKPLRTSVNEFLTKKPNANIYELQDEFKQANRHVLHNYKSEFRKNYLLKSIDLIKLKHIDNVLNKKTAIVRNVSEAEKEAIAYLHQLVKEVVLKK